MLTIFCAYSCDYLLARSYGSPRQSEKRLALTKAMLSLFSRPSFSVRSGRAEESISLAPELYVPSPMPRNFHRQTPEKWLPRSSKHSLSPIYHLRGDELAVPEKGLSPAPSNSRSVDVAQIRIGRDSDHLGIAPVTP